MKTTIDELNAGVMPSHNFTIDHLPVWERDFAAAYAQPGEVVNRHGDICIAEFTFCQYGVVAVLPRFLEQAEALGWKRCGENSDCIIVQRDERDRP